MHLIAPRTLQGSFNLAIVVSQFNSSITEELLNGALQRLKELEFETQQITVVRVPGAVEIPIATLRLATTDRYQAIICLGAVIYGETRHFDYVCQQVTEGCLQISLSHNIPVIFGVLTTQTMEQAIARVGGEKGHMGRYSVDTAVELLSVLEQIES